MNKKELEELMKKIGNNKPTDDELENIKQMADKYSDKSKDEIFFEIIKLNKKMQQKMDSKKYNEIMSKLESIRPFLNEQQLERLDDILEAIKEE